SSPYERIVTRAHGRSPRQVGVSTVSIVAVSPGSMRTAWAYGSAAPADGTQASRTSPRSVRTPSLVTCSATVAESPSRTWFGPEGCGFRPAAGPATGGPGGTGPATAATTTPSGTQGEADSSVQATSVGAPRPNSSAGTRQVITAATEGSG